MNWGNKLLMVFIAFAGLMSYMVYRCVQTPVDLVSKDYYKEELAYQEIIDGTNEANSLHEKIDVSQISDTLLVQFPGKFAGKSISGEIFFYCASDASKDRDLKLRLDMNGRQAFELRNFHPASYIIKIKWQDEMKKYYSEQSFIIN